MHIYENKRQVVEVTMVELDRLPDATPVTPGHAADARLMAPCGRWEGNPPIKKVPTQYPYEARVSHQQGTVILYAALAADGSVEHLKLLASAGGALDDASRQAVAHWVYPPVTCGAEPLPTEIEVQVSFTLSPY